MDAHYSERVMEVERCSRVGQGKGGPSATYSLERVSEGYLCYILNHVHSQVRYFWAMIPTRKQHTNSNGLTFFPTYCCETGLLQDTQ